MLDFPHISTLNFTGRTLFCSSVPEAVGGGESVAGLVLTQPGLRSAIQDRLEFYEISQSQMLRASTELQNTM